MNDFSILAPVSFVDLRTINDTDAPLIEQSAVRVYRSAPGEVSLQLRANAPIQAASRHAKNLAKRDIVATASLSIAQLLALRDAINDALAA